MGMNRLRCLGDSDLVAEQSMVTCDAVNPNMIAYHQAVDRLAGHFMGHSVEWIDRRKYEEADQLSRIVSSRQPPPPGVFLDTIDKPSVTVPKEIDLAVPPAPGLDLVAVLGED